MKLKYIIICLLPFLFTNCENEDNRDNNPCLLDKSVNFSLNQSLPEFGDLIRFTGTSMFIRDNINFIEGIYVFNNGTDFFTVLELAEPNDCENICTIPRELNDKGQFEYTCGDVTRLYNVEGERVFEEDEDISVDNNPMRRYNAIRSNGILTITF